MYIPRSALLKQVAHKCIYFPDFDLLVEVVVPQELVPEPVQLLELGPLLLTIGMVIVSFS